MTDKLGIEHTFSFNEAWGYVEYKKALGELKTPSESFMASYTPEDFKKGIVEVENKISNSEFAIKGDDVDRYNPLRHFFAEGQYIREVFNPSGELIVTKIHKYSHPFFLLKGKMSIMSEEGEKTIEAPFYGITPKGTKRIIYAHTDCVFVTVHNTDKTDINEIEKEIISESFEEL